MGRNVNSSNLSKNYILSKVSQVTIFSTYFDLPVQIINNCIETGELILSPIRNDQHPTCGFRYDNRGRLKFKDFAGYFWGDCFDAVALVLSTIKGKQYNVSNKNDFIAILTHITYTFKNIFYGTEIDTNAISLISNSLELIKKKKPVIELVVREWTEEDKKYWNNFGITLQYLNLNFVYPIDQYYIDRKINPQPKYFYKESDPCYAYYLGKDKNNIMNIKLYFPNRHHQCTRFITNCNHLEGILNLTRNDYDFIVITKSTKDRLSIGCTLLSTSLLYRQDAKNKIGIINVPHETYKLRSFEYDWLRSKLSINGIIVSLMDNDRTGYLEAQWLRKKYDIVPLIIPKEYESKDFAELRSKVTFDNIIELIKSTINKVEEYEKTKEYIRNKETSDISPF